MEEINEQIVVERQWIKDHAPTAMQLTGIHDLRGMIGKLTQPAVLLVRILSRTTHRPLSACFHDEHNPYSEVENLTFSPNAARTPSTPKKEGCIPYLDPDIRCSISISLVMRRGSLAPGTRPNLTTSAPLTLSLGSLSPPETQSWGWDEWRKGQMVWRYFHAHVCG